MGREINRLTARKAQTLSVPGQHADGGGLYLVVDPSGARRWMFRYRLNGKRREMGLGPVQSVPLVRAREMAAEARTKIAAGIDPVEEKRVARAKPEPIASVTFADVATAYMADRETSWRNAKHRAQWRQTLEFQAASLWSLPIADVTTEHVLAVLRPIWTTKAATAQRIRGRIEAVLDAGRAAGHRPGENPARWRGHLDKLLPRMRKLTRGHHAAMPYLDVPDFYAALGTRSGFAARALRLAILTAARSGEVRGMTWGEVDLDKAIWIVPGARMKGGREHRVPLSVPAAALLADIRPDKPAGGALVFPSRNGAPFTDKALSMFLRRAEHGDATAHGFRSSFRDWVAEETDFAGDIAEAALAHLTGDETERAYRRGDALAKRRALMDHWAAFVTRAASM